VNVAAQYGQAKVATETQFTAIMTTLQAIASLHRTDCEFNPAVVQTRLMKLDRAFK